VVKSSIESPKLKEILVIVPSESLPVAVKVRGYGAVPLVKPLTPRIEQTGVSDEDDGGGNPGEPGAEVTGIEVGVIVTAVEVTVTFAGMVVDSTFSLVWSEEAIDRTCVLGAESKVMFGVVGVVELVALS